MLRQRFAHFGRREETDDVLWYQGLTQTETADVLNVTDRTARRRWVSAKMKLHEAFGGEAHPEEGQTDRRLNRFPHHARP